MKPDEELDAQSFRESAAAMDVDPDSGHSEGMNVGHANGSISFFPSSTAERSVFDLYTSGVPNAFGASFYPGDGDDGAD